MTWVENGSRDFCVRKIKFRCCPLALCLHPLFSEFFLKTLIFLKTEFFYECKGDHGGERYGDEMVN